MNERIKKLRKFLELTQREFAERIGMKQNSIAIIESGRKTSDQTVLAICREFNVNEEWLRNGTGEMFRAAPNAVLDILAEEYNLTHGDYVLIEKFVNMKAEKRAVFTEFVLEAAAAMQAEGAEPAVLAFPDSSKMSIDEKVADYRRQLELEEKAKGRSEALQENA